MDDSQLLRYSRHILLPEIGIEGQMKLLASRVLIIGAGGLGSPAAMFLASSGIGTLTLCDDDLVDLTNLQRQIAHRSDSIGFPKVESARTTLSGINPGIKIVALQERADERRLGLLAEDVDLVLDCSDNFPTRYALNRVCSKLKKPLVSGAATRFDGQVSVFDFRRHDSPCYHCLFPEQMESEETRCAVLGIFAPLVGIIGSLQAAEALKLLTGIETTLCGRMLTINALNMELRTIKLVRDPDCPVCQNNLA
ncbi:MAG: molybdopterin-synthase adenylyltransferase MoeB [Pseudomonadota bacterium]